MLLRQWLHKNGLFISEFAPKTLYTAQYISSVMSGRYKASPKFIKIIALHTKGEVLEKDWQGIVQDPLRKHPRGKTKKSLGDKL